MYVRNPTTDIILDGKALLENKLKQINNTFIHSFIQSQSTIFFDYFHFEIDNNHFENRTYGL